MSQHIEFVPSPAEIAAVCAEIQATWSDTDRRLRSRGIDLQPPDGGKEAEAAARLEMEFTLAQRRKRAR